MDERLPRSNSDLPLFGAGARASDPETSKEAAESLSAEAVNGIRRQVLEGLARLGGSAISDELVSATGLEWRTLTPRLRPLANLGLIVEAGTRRGSSGRMQTVWALSTKGAEVL